MKDQTLEDKIDEMSDKFARIQAVMGLNSHGYSTTAMEKTKEFRQALLQLIEEEVSNLLYHLHGYDKGEVALLDLQINDTVQSLLELIHQERLRARIEELGNIAVNDDENVILCYFTQENPDCSKDIKLGDRIKELQQELNKGSEG